MTTISTTLFAMLCLLVLMSFSGATLMCGRLEEKFLPLVAGQTTISLHSLFKVSELNFQVLSEQPGFRPAPYIAARGMNWIQQYNDTENADETLKYYLSESHRIVSLGLTKKKQKELGLNQR